MERVHPGRRLKAARLAAGLGGREFAKLVGVTESMLYQAEAGRKFLGITNTVRAAQLLGVTVEWLFESASPAVDTIQHVERGRVMPEDERRRDRGGGRTCPITPKQAIANYELIMSEPNLFLKLKGSSLTVEDQADIADYIRFVRQRERGHQEEQGGHKEDR